MRTTTRGLLALAAVSGLARAAARADLQASATIVESPGSFYPYHYDLVLTNTGTTPISTFWYAWDDSELNFMTQYPYSITDAADWSDSPTYNYYDAGIGWGIEWSTSDSPLMPGGSLPGFSFESYESPEELAATSPVPPVNPGDDPFPTGTSFVYIGGAEADPGFQFVVAPALTPVPEPASLGLGAATLLLLAGRRRNPRG